MSLLNDILGGLAGGGQAQGGQAGANPMLNIVLGMLANSGQGRQGGGVLGGLESMLGQGQGQGSGGSGAGSLLAAVGGIGGLIAMFQKAGLGDAMQSWVGTGQNQQITPDQMTQVLGHDKVGEIASHLGVSNGEAAGQLSQMLPQIIDALTPHGQVPQGGFGGAGDILSALSGMMARR